MKSLKLVLIVTFVAFLMVSIAEADGFQGKPKKAINITFAAAMKNPELVQAMHGVSPAFLDHIDQLYVVKVVSNWTQYNVLGSRQDWIGFFRPQLKTLDYYRQSE
jgi:hypothetical protein